MAVLTSQQANELADNFLAMAKVIGEYRVKNFDNLTEQQNENLKELHTKVLDYSDDLYTLSATLVLDDVQTSLAAIGNVTTQMKGTFNSLQNIQKVINVATSVATLGAAVISKDPQAIGNSIKELVNSWKA